MSPLTTNGVRRAERAADPVRNWVRLYRADGCQTLESMANKIGLSPFGRPEPTFWTSGRRDRATDAAIDAILPDRRCLRRRAGRQHLDRADP